MTGASPSRAGVVCCAIVAIALAQLAAQQRSPDGTGEISGTIVSATAPAAPIARVLVTISGDTLKPSRTVISDEQGRFVFKNLPSGTFTIVAARPPFVRTAFGAKRPGRTGTPILLESGQHVAGLTLPLARGGAISGVIRHPGGAVGAGVTVTLARLDGTLDAGAGSAIADDRGVFRFFGLTPGNYLVAANLSDRISGASAPQSDEDLDEIIARLQRRSTGAPVVRPRATAGGTAATYARSYFPGTFDPDQATVVTLTEGEDRTGIDIGLQLVRTSTVHGRVSAATGPLSSRTQLTLTRVGQRVVPTTLRATPEASGTFSFTNVLPGQYRLMARATEFEAVEGSGGTLRIASSSWAIADVFATGGDSADILLVMRPALRFSGRFQMTGRATTAADRASILLRLVATDAADATVSPGFVRADGTFEIDGVVPGRYRFLSEGAPTGWTLRSAILDGRDLLDSPIDITGATDISGVVVTLSDQHTELSGMLESAAHAAAPDYFVVAFAADRSFWRPGSRRIQFTRPNTNGRFILRELPPGNYLIAALTDMEPADLDDASFLERLVAGSQPVTINEGAKTVQDLMIVK